MHRLFRCITRLQCGYIYIYRFIYGMSSWLRLYQLSALLYGCTTMTLKNRKKAKWVL